MPGSKCFKPVEIRDVAGLLDTRSTPDQVPPNGYRWVLNHGVTQKRRVCRFPGWTKFLDRAPYNNQDLHDQLFGHGNETITMIYNAKSVAGFSKLFVGTQSRIYSFNSSTGNWRIISDQLGGETLGLCPERRWTAALVGDTVLFTNNFDKPVAHRIDESADADDQAVTQINDLNTLNVTKANLVFAWNNLMILANIEQDGRRFGNRIIWSDYRKPSSWIPESGVSLAGRFDLDETEIILGFAPIQNALLVFTNQSIWETRVSGTEGVLSFARRWKAKDSSERALAYRNSLVSTGDEIYYWGKDGIYKYDLYSPLPELVEWIHRASATIFDDLDARRCNVHCSGYQGTKHQIWWSWAKRGETCPSQSFVINTEFPFSSFIDHGFTAFGNVSFDELRSLRQFIFERCICPTPEALNAAGGGFVNEGGVCFGETAPVCPEPTPKSFYSLTPLVDGDITVEDYTGEPDADSLFALLEGLTVSDLCDEESSADECDAEEIYVMASTQDNCLKQASDIYYREVCTNKTGCGAYEQRGYRSLLRSGAIDLGWPDDEKIVNRFAMEAHPEEQTVPSQIQVRVGMAANAVDPNVSRQRCVILWDDLEPRELDCLSEDTMAEHLANGTRPDSGLEWGLYQEGRFIYFELEIMNPKSTPVDTGGATCYSRFTFDALAKPRCG